jgi:hypothetical protein
MTEICRKRWVLVSGQQGWSLLDQGIDMGGCEKLVVREMESRWLCHQMICFCLTRASLPGGLMRQVQLRYIEVCRWLGLFDFFQVNLHRRNLESSKWCSNCKLRCLFQIENQIGPVGGKLPSCQEGAIPDWLNHPEERSCCTTKGVWPPCGLFGLAFIT